MFKLRWKWSIAKYHSPSPTFSKVLEVFLIIHYRRVLCFFSPRHKKLSNMLELTIAACQEAITKNII